MTSATTIVACTYGAGQQAAGGHHVGGRGSGPAPSTTYEQFWHDCKRREAEADARNRIRPRPTHVRCYDCGAEMPRPWGYLPEDDGYHLCGGRECIVEASERETRRVQAGASELREDLSEIGRNLARLEVK